MEASTVIVWWCFLYICGTYDGCINIMYNIKQTKKIVYLRGRTDPRNRKKPPNSYLMSLFYDNGQ